MVSEGAPSNVNQECTNTTAVGQPREESNRCITFCACSKILPTKSTTISAVRLRYLCLFEDLCVMPILQNKMRVIASFIGPRYGDHLLFNCRS